MDEKELREIRATCLRCAVNLHRSSGGPTPNRVEVLQDAAAFERYIHAGAKSP